VLDAEAITHVDASGLESLVRLAEDLRREQITLVVARLRTRMEEQLASTGVAFYPTVRAAVDATAV
jgi:anti-anti-sigma regulatory factor